MNNESIQNESEVFQAPMTTYKPAGFAFAALAILFLLYQVVGGGITLLFIGGEITENNITKARLATMVSQFLFLLLPTIYLAKRQHGKLSEVFRMRIPTFRETFLAIVGMLALMQAAEMYLYIQSKIPLPDDVARFVEMIKQSVESVFKILISAHSPSELLFVVGVAALTPSLCEEFLFRGLIQKNFSFAYGSKKGFIIAGTIFGIYHLNPFWLVPLIVLGIYFSFLQHRSKTLLLPILAHFINNATAAVSVYFYGITDTSTPTMFLGEQSEPSLSAVIGTGVFFSLIFYLIMVYYSRTTENIQD